jgi:hypothetical protein
MRLLLVLLVLGGLGYVAYLKVPAFTQQVDKVLARFQESESAAPAEDEPASSPELAPAGRPPVARPTPFASKIAPPAAPGEKQLAAPGVFYVLDRTSIMTDSGVHALNPGEEVRLLQRLPGGKMKVRMGTMEFEVKDSQVTNDLNIAREAEKREFVARGGQL